MIGNSMFIDKDTPEVMALKAEHDGLLAQERMLTQRAREIEEEVDRIHMAARPELPTPNQRIGIRNALAAIWAGIKPDDHLGDPCAPGDYKWAVTVDGRRGWLCVKHLSPYSQRNRGGHLWQITEDELDDIKQMIDTNGFEVVEHWMHDQGVSIIVRKKALA